MNPSPLPYVDPHLGRLFPYYCHSTANEVLEVVKSTTPVAATFHPAREHTASVLQPGRYKLVRGGQTVAVSAAKYLQNIEITGRARTG